MIKVSQISLALLLLLLLAQAGWGATLYWYGGSGNWSDYTNHWSTNSGNSPAAPAGAAPTSSDSVVFDSASDSGSAYTVTIDATANCLDMTWGAQDQTPTLAGTAALNVYGSVTLVAGMTASYSGSLWMKATSGTKSITTNGVTFNGSLLMDGAGATFQLGGDLTLATSGAAFRRIAGSFDANGKTLALSGAIHTITGTFTNSNAFYDLTRTGSTAVSSYWTIADNIAVSHTLTINGSSTSRRDLLRSDVVGTQRTISAASYTATNADFQDIKVFDYAADQSIVCIGDSLTYSDTYPLALEALVQNYSGPHWKRINAGVSGNETDDMLARFAADVVALSPQYVVIMGGINDADYGRSAAAIEADLQAMYDAADLAGITVVAVTITPYGDSAGWAAEEQVVLEEVNAWILDTATNVDYRIDAYSVLEDPADPDATLTAYANADGKHLSATGYAVLANTIYAGVTWVAPPATTWDLSAATGGSGDCGGNARITFTTAAPQYWKHGATASVNWSTTGNWYLASNGQGGAGRLPLPQDTAIFDASAFAASGKTVSINMPRIPATTFAAVTNSPTIATLSVSSLAVYGSLSLAPAANWTCTALAVPYTFKGRSVNALTTNGNTWAANLTLDAPSGTLTLADWPTNAADKTFTVTNGTLSASYKVFAPAENTAFTQGGGTITLYNCDFYRAVAGGTLVSKTAGTLNLKNNIFYNITDVLASTGGTNNISHNDYFQSSDEGGTGSITSDPLLVTPGTDFHLQADSPAINVGTDVGVTTDYAGNLVPMGGAPEIGAYEYIQSGQAGKSAKENKTGGK